MVPTKMLLSTTLVLCVLIRSSKAQQVTTMIECDCDSEVYGEDLFKRYDYKPTTVTFHGETYTITGPTTLHWSREGATRPGTYSEQISTSIWHSTMTGFSVISGWSAETPSKPTSTPTPSSTLSVSFSSPSESSTSLPTTTSISSAATFTSSSYSSSSVERHTTSLVKSTFLSTSPRAPSPTTSTQTMTKTGQSPPTQAATTVQASSISCGDTLTITTTRSSSTIVEIFVASCPHKSTTSSANVEAPSSDLSSGPFSSTTPLPSKQNVVSSSFPPASLSSKPYTTIPLSLPVASSSSVKVLTSSTPLSSKQNVESSSIHPTSLSSEPYAAIPSSLPVTPITSKTMLTSSVLLSSSFARTILKSELSKGLFSSTKSPKVVSSASSSEAFLVPTSTTPTITGCSTVTTATFTVSEGTIETTTLLIPAVCPTSTSAYNDCVKTTVLTSSNSDGTPFTSAYVNSDLCGPNPHNITLPSPSSSYSTAVRTVTTNGVIYTYTALIPCTSIQTTSPSDSYKSTATTSLTEETSSAYATSLPLASQSSLSQANSASKSHVSSLALLLVVGFFILV